jgi:hypothetical protein
VVILKDDGEHLHLFLNGAVPIDLVERVLLEERRLEQGAHFQNEVLTVRQRIRSYQFDDLLQTDFPLQEIHDFLTVLRPQTIRMAFHQSFTSGRYSL